MRGPISPIPRTQLFVIWILKQEFASGYDFILNFREVDRCKPAMNSVNFTSLSGR